MKNTILLLTAILVLIFCLFGCKSTNKNSVPDISELSIADIHTHFENGTLTSELLVKSYLEKIEEKNQIINAITFTNPNAIEDARKLDQEFAQSGILKPLHGIPLLVKDNINVKGIPTTAGSRAMLDNIPAEDAFIIKKLKEAGAVILAKTNMAEWAFSAMHTESTTGGTTKNPYNTQYVPAGSSGGTGAAIAANFATIGLGTDTGNSIRGPSSHNALVGFRTTLGLISRSAIVPLLLRNDVVGPMCRNVEDATRVLEVMVGKDPDDPLTSYSEGKIPDNYQQFLQKEGLERARIGILADLTDDVHPEIKSLFDQAINDLKALGAVLEKDVRVPLFDSLRQNQWCSTFKKDVEEYLSTYGSKNTPKKLKDIISFGTNSDYAKTRLERYLDFQSRWGEDSTPCGEAYTDPLRIAFRMAIDRTMDSLGLDALVYPTWSYPPAHLDRFEEEYLGDNNQVICPHTGQPGFTVPMGFTKENLPAGLQFLGRMYAEPTLIKLAYAYEQGTKHRKPPNI